MRAKILFHLRWAAAILVAALFGGGARIHKAFLALFGILKDRGEMVSDEVYRKRIQTCEKCLLWYAPLRTCGSPLAKNLRGYGCYCAMDVKARFEVSECWLDEQAVESDEFGWKANGCATPKEVQA